MSALPIFDERRREFVERRLDPSPTAKPELRAVGTSAIAPANAPARMPVEPAARFAFLQAYLERLRRRFDESGETAAVQIVSELIAVLANREVAKNAAPEVDHQPIYAVCAAYVTALATIAIDEAAAAQLLARKLITQGYAPPRNGGDTRAWKRLLLWRDQLERGRLPAELRVIYERTLKFALKAPNEIDLKAALDHALAADGRAA